MVSTASANVRCEDDLPRIKLELKQPKLAASTSVYNKQKHPFTKGLLVMLTLLSTSDLLQQSSKPGPNELKIMLTPSRSLKVKLSPMHGSMVKETKTDSSVTPKEARICLY